VVERKVGDRSEPEAMVELTNAYKRALDIAPDHEKAGGVRLKFATLAAALGDTETVTELARTGLAEDSPEQLFLTAQAAIIAGESTRAEQLLKQLLENHPDFNRITDAKLDLADVLLTQGKTGEAEAVWREVEKSHPMDRFGTQAKRQLADVAEMRGDLDSALQRQKALLARAQSNEEEDQARLAIAKIYRKKGNLRRMANEVYQISPGRYDREGLQSLAQAYFDVGRYESAERAAADGLEAYPVDKKMAILRGRSLIASSTYDDAVQSLKEYRQEHPGSAELHFLYAEAARHDGLKAEALAAYRTVAERFPLSPFGYDSYTRLAQLLLDGGKEGAAYSILKQQVSLYLGSTRHRKGLERLGDLYQNCGVPAEAADAYRSILRQFPDTYGVRYKLATVLMEAEGWVEALDQLAQIDRALCPPEVSYNTLVATAKIQQSFGLYKEAEDNLMLALQDQDQREFRALADLALLYIETEKTGPARKAFADAKPLAGKVGEQQDFYRSLGARWADYMYLQGDFLTAARVLQEMIEVLPASSPELEWAYLQLGNSYLKLGRRGEASEAFNRLLKDFPNSQWTGLAQIKGRYASLLKKRENLVGAT